MAVLFRSSLHRTGTPPGGGQRSRRFCHDRAIHLVSLATWRFKNFGLRYILVMNVGAVPSWEFLMVILDRCSEPVHTQAHSGMKEV